jgi:hypothetical protein
LGAPPIEATAAYSPSCSTRIRAFLRSFPDVAPIDVTTMIGTPRLRGLAPFVRSYSSTWLRVRSLELGA